MITRVFLKTLLISLLLSLNANSKIFKSTYLAVAIMAIASPFFKVGGIEDLKVLDMGLKLNIIKVIFARN